jgi:hypothetical protein
MRVVGSLAAATMTELDGTLAILPNSCDALTKLFEVEKATA